MTFTASLCIGLFVFCIGGALASIVCELSAKIGNRRCLKSRFAITCVLLSGAVASAAATLIYVPGLFMMFPLSRSDTEFLVFLFLLGAGCSGFWKFMLPAAVFLYIFISIFTGVRLYRTFGTMEENHEISVTSGTVYVDENPYPAAEKTTQSVVISVYTLPHNLLLPLPRVWYCIKGVVPADGEKFSAQNFSTAPLLVFRDSSEQGKDSSGFFRRTVQKYDSWLVSDQNFKYVHIPQESVLPVLYTMICHSFGGRLYCIVNRSL
jgi:hypothetical protein